MAAPFDVAKLELTGAPVAVIENVRESVTGVGGFACAPTGTCAYLSGGMAGASTWGRYNWQPNSA